MTTPFRQVARIHRDFARAPGRGHADRMTPGAHAIVVSRYHKAVRKLGRWLVEEQLQDETEAAHEIQHKHDDSSAYRRVMEDIEAAAMCAADGGYCVYCSGPTTPEQEGDCGCGEWESYSDDTYYAVDFEALGVHI